MSSQESIDTFREYVKERLREDYKKRLAALPWWCGMCGAGGNGWKPGDDTGAAMLPPTEHYDGDCNPKFDKLRGIEA